MPAYNYILECSDGTLYTGWTSDLSRRMKAHSSGAGAKYTRPRLPVRLVFVEIHESRQAAMRREYEIKQMARSEKLELIRNGTVNIQQFAEDRPSKSRVGA